MPKRSFARIKGGLGQAQIVFRLGPCLTHVPRDSAGERKGVSLCQADRQGPEAHPAAVPTHHPAAPRGERPAEEHREWGTASGAAEQSRAGHIASHAAIPGPALADGRHELGN